jgi:hypothetical protein
MKRPNPYKEVYDFNAAVKVGDTVEFSEVIGIGEPIRYQTESEAEVLGEHTAVVWLKGKRGCVKLSHCKPIPAERELTPEAQVERADFKAEYGSDGNCACHLGCTQCGSCTHLGNPRNQEEDESCWQGAA